MFLQSVEHVHWSDSKQSIVLSEHSHMAHVPTAPLDVSSARVSCTSTVVTQRLLVSQAR